MESSNSELREQRAESSKLEKLIQTDLKDIKYGE